MVGFRLSAKYVFLTYPQSTGLDHSYLHNHLKTVESVSEVYSCREPHEDGQSFHHHAICASVTKFNIRNERYFDVEYGGTTYHPSVESVRNLSASNTYIGKDGCTLGYAIIGARPGRKRDYSDCITQSSTAEEFMSAVRKCDPVNYVLNYARIEYYCTQHFNRKLNVGQIYERCSFKVPEVMDKWVRENLFNRPNRPKCLVIVGENDTGKTKWAQSLGVPYHYWHARFTGRLVAGAQYAILDDFDGMKRNEMKGFWGCQEIIGVKTSNGVSGHKQWDWGIPSIILWNELPEWWGQTTYEYKRCVYVYIGSNKLF